MEIPINSIQLRVRRFKCCSKWTNLRFLFAHIHKPFPTTRNLSNRCQRLALSAKNAHTELVMHFYDESVHWAQASSLYSSKKKKISLTTIVQLFPVNAVANLYMIVTLCCSARFVANEWEKLVFASTRFCAFGFCLERHQNSSPSSATLLLPDVIHCCRPNCTYFVSFIWCGINFSIECFFSLRILCWGWKEKSASRICIQPLKLQSNSCLSESSKKLLNIFSCYSFSFSLSFSHL